MSKVLHRHALKKGEKYEKKIETKWRNQVEVHGIFEISGRKIFVNLIKPYQKIGEDGKQKDLKQQRVCLVATRDLYQNQPGRGALYIAKREGLEKARKLRGKW